MKVTCLNKNFTAQKVVKFVILASGTVRMQMNLRYGGNTIQIMTYDLRLTEKILKTFLVGTLQTVEGKGEKRGEWERKEKEKRVMTLQLGDLSFSY